MRLVLDMDGASFQFTPLNDREGPYPYLVSVGTKRIAARAGRVAGLGVGESPNLDVLLQNNARQAASIIGSPLRAGAKVYDDAAALFFDGIVSKITFGKTITLILES